MLEVVPVGYEPLGNAPRAVQMLELVRIETAPLEIFEPQQVRQKDDEPSGDEERGVAPPGCARGRAFAGARASHVAVEVSTTKPQPFEHTLLEPRRLLDEPDQAGLAPCKLRDLDQHPDDRQ